MKLVFKLKDTGFYIRNYYSKETISKLWQDVKNLRKYAVFKYDKIVTHDFRPKR